MSRNLEMKWGIIFVAMMLIWMVLEKLLGFHDQYIEYHPIVTNFVMIPAIWIYVVALKRKKKEAYNGSMTFGQGFKSGLIMTLVITLLSPLTQYVTSIYITPDYFSNVINYSVENNLMTLQEAQDYFNLKSYMIQTVAMTPVMGIVTTLIVAGIVSLRKKN
ncbi:MAG: DUF4199 domain-containing protein [Bacteroidetes bacterium]|nr:DUF4199 domain-containing protein [Bacteroidota bacterium]